MLVNDIDSQMCPIFACESTLTQLYIFNRFSQYAIDSFSCCAGIVSAREEEKGAHLKFKLASICNNINSHICESC